ncbi:MAG: hypothetical protein DHS20C17_03140 [Cyclobacteriaceae bacterium]|nr:MAG: hypothetical protein DHS20C17_03140 [Cyclobacteriaceae bacterium]
MKKLALGFIMIVGFSMSGQEHEIIRSIYFGGGSYYITESQRNAISNFLDSLPHIENYQISISSHTDNIGGVEYNQWLSQMRSEAVMYQLIEKEIPRDKVIIRNNGQYNPYFDNKTYIGRLSNRRVDIIFTPPVF